MLPANNAHTNPLGCEPTRLFYVEPHGMYSSKITVYDVTSMFKINEDLEDLVKQVGKMLKTQPVAPCLTVDCNLWSSRRKVYIGPNRQPLAEWKTKALSGHTNLNFSGGPVGSQEVKMKPAHMMSRSEEFVFNSAQYSWEQDSKWHEHRSTMYMNRQGQNFIIGKSAQKRKRDLTMTYKLEGLLALDERQIDWSVGVLSYLVTLYKAQINRAAVSAAV